MSKSLIIAEKPSVASDLARALGGFKKVEDHFENENYIISSAIGHLVELCLPSELDVKRGKWSFANLPIIPDEFELKPIEKSKPRFNQLKRLIQRKDVINNWPNVSGLQQATDLAQLLTARFDDEVDEPYP